jgi:bifunctional non-homologous end joining protein LigD
MQKSIPGAVAPSKQALAEYWETVFGQALHYLGYRPLTLVRSVRGKTFYHRGPLPPIPAAVHQMRIEKGEGGEGVRLWVDNLEGLLGLVTMDVVELHPWGAIVADIEHPDLLAFNLKPGRDISWERVVDTALELQTMLKLEGYDSWPKVIGEQDLHVMVPVDRTLTWSEARPYSKQLAQRLAATAPSRYTLSAGPANRVGRIYIDYTRNGRGATTVGAYSPRALPGFPIATAVTWTELQKGLRPDAFTIARPRTNDVKSSKRSTTRRRKPVRRQSKP